MWVGSSSYQVYDMVTVTVVVIDRIIRVVVPVYVSVYCLVCRSMSQTSQTHKYHIISMTILISLS